MAREPRRSRTGSTTQFVRGRQRSGVAPSLLPANTHVTTWQWEAELVQLPEAERDRIQSFADATLRSDRLKIALPYVDVSINDGSSAIIRISSNAVNDRFVFEVGRSYVIYRHEPARSAKVADPIGEHIRRIALPFLQQLAADEQIGGRLTATGMVYELASTLKRGGRTNKQLAIDRLVGGLRSRPWERRLGSAPQSLERIDLKWATSTTVLREKASLWFKVECPTNDAHTVIDTTCVVKSASQALPSPAWASAADKVHDTAWQITVDFMTWLFSNPR